MLNVTNATKKIIQSSFIAYNAMQNKYLNITAYAKTILPEVEKMTKKNVQIGTIVTALTRYQSDVIKQKHSLPIVQISDVVIVNNILEITYEKTINTITALQEIQFLQKNNTEVFIMTQGQSEISIFAQQKWKKQIQDIFKDNVCTLVLEDLSCITIRLDAKYLHESNVLLAILMQFSTHNIVIAELISTYTEVSLIVHSTDIETAFSIIQKATK